MPPCCLTVPNVSEGADRAVLDELVAATRPLRLLDLHSDPDHGRSVLDARRPAGRGRARARAAGRGGRAADRHDGARRPPPARRRARRRAGRLPRPTPQRGAACAEALTAGALIGADAGVPVFLYGALATGRDRVERAAIRAGGPARAGAADRARARSCPTSARRELHPTGGATLVTARPPLIAFNVDLASDDVELAKRDRRRPARVGRRAAGRARDRPARCPRAGARRSRSTSTTTAPRRSRELVEAVRARRRRWPRRSSSAWPRRPRSTAFPPMCRCAASIPSGT